MVLAATTPINSYVGNATANVFPFTFPIFNQAHILVIVTNTTTGEAQTLDIATDYTVSGLNPAGEPASTGAITLVSSGQAWLSGGNLATDWTLTIMLNVPLAQTFSFRNQGDFYRTSLENALDYEMMANQQLQVGGFVLTDIVTGSTYRLVMINGVLSQIQLT